MMEACVPINPHDVPSDHDADASSMEVRRRRLSSEARVWRHEASDLAPFN